LEDQRRIEILLQLMGDRYGVKRGKTTELEDPFHTLVSCILSHRTRDQNSREASKRLFEAAENPVEVLKMPHDELKERIRCSGFYNQKARNIRAICKALKEEHQGRVPKDRGELLSLRGVGPKTADIVLSRAFGRPAIPVDVHVSTVAKRLGFVEEGAGPERVKEVLESLVPSGDYGFLDDVFVKHGKELCRSRNPRCGECFVRHHCSYPDPQTR
jgi:endonuclease-3